MKAKGQAHRGSRCGGDAVLLVPRTYVGNEYNMPLDVNPGVVFCLYSLPPIEFFLCLC